MLPDVYEPPIHTLIVIIQYAYKNLDVFITPGNSFFITAAMMRSTA